MPPRRRPSPPWPWATGPTRPTRSEPSLGRSELPRDRYTHMSQIEQVNSLPCSRLARRPGGCAASHREHTTSADIAVAGVTRKSRSRRAPGGCYVRYVTLLMRLRPRFKDAEQVRSDELLARCC